MKLEKVQFEDFKSIGEGTLDIERGITTLVGINEAGKSNVLFAIEKADKKKILENYDIRRNSDRVYSDTESPKLTLTYDLSDSESEDLSVLFGVKPQDISRVVISKEGSKYSLHYPSINYEGSSVSQPTPATPVNIGLAAAEAQLTAIISEISSKKEELKRTIDEAQIKVLTEQIKDLEVKLPGAHESKKQAQSDADVDGASRKTERESAVRAAVVDKLVKDYLPRVLFFDSVGIDNFYLPLDGRVEIDKLLASPTKHRPIINLLALGGITDLEILKPSTDPRKGNLRKQRLNQASTRINNELLRKHWPLDMDVEFSISTDETNFLLINLKQKDDDTMYVPGDRSRGLQWSIAFNIYFLSESQGGELQNSILLIDEPGVFLHIDAQKKLLEDTFPAILKGNNQIIYTTHLPYLIHSGHPERIRILEKRKKGGETTIGNKAWSEGKISEIPEPVKTALGTKWAEWFGMDDKNCMVEGPSDQVILRSLVLKVGGDYNFIPAYGKDSLPSAVTLSKLDEKNSIGIVDNDLSVDEKNALIAKLGLVNINPGVIADISALAEDSTVSTIEDIVPEDIYRNATHKVYERKLSKLDKDYKKDDIPVSYPRVKNFESFFGKKTGKPGHLFQKMEVARAIADIVLSVEGLAANNPKWTLVRKVSKNIGILLEKKLLLKDKKKESSTGE